MNNLCVFVLKCFRHAYQALFGTHTYQPVPLCSIEEGGEMIFNMLSKKEPCMIARYGANELNCVSNYLEIKFGEHKIMNYITGKSSDWWWNKGMKRTMYDGAGFYPVTDANLAKFVELMIEDSKYVDVLAIFPAVYRNLHNIFSFIPKDIQIIPLVSYDSFLYDNPWTRILEGKKVLVVHPFSEQIRNQYKKRKYLFKNKNVLPKFDLQTLKAVQSMGGVSEQGFSSWFEGLEWMINEMDKKEYEIALIGCGAYGFPLAAHAKRTGHKAVHIGGTLQLLFGIKGRRWENPFYGTDVGIPKGTYLGIMDNPYWVRPDEYRSNQSDKVENACYW